MSISKISKIRLGPLNIVATDINSGGLPVTILNGTSSWGTATDGQYLRWTAASNAWVPAPIPSQVTFVDAEIPSGTANNVNTVFVLSTPPSPSASLKLFVGGLLMSPGSAADYTLSSQTITFTSNVIPPGPNDTILAYYRH